MMITTQSYKNINLLFPTTFIAAFNLSTWSGQDSNPLPYDHIQDDRFNRFILHKKDLSDFVQRLFRLNHDIFQSCKCKKYFYN